MKVLEVTFKRSYVGDKPEIQKAIVCDRHLAYFMPHTIAAAIVTDGTQECVWCHEVQAEQVMALAQGVLA